MGQRHQIYLFFASGHSGLLRAGVHHQWLYGSKPLRKLHQFLRFVAKSAADPDNVWDDSTVYRDAYDQHSYAAGKALAALYSLDLNSGHISPALPLDSPDDKLCLTDPSKGDNNDGITIIDLQQPQSPRIAFYFFDQGALQRLSGSVATRTALSSVAVDWVCAGDLGVSEDLQHTPLTANQYLSLYYNRLVTSCDSRQCAPAGSWEIADTLDADYELLSMDDIRLFFPDMCIPNRPNAGCW